ncbi:hypothetical protein P7C70_g7421, partial [Phenoliferia sp. Uapishka_3]
MDLALATILLRDVRVSLFLLSGLPSNANRRGSTSTPLPPDRATPTLTQATYDKDVRSRRFSNPWRPASRDNTDYNNKSSFPAESFLDALFDLRSVSLSSKGATTVEQNPTDLEMPQKFRLAILQLISATFFIVAVVLPVSHDYSTFTDSGRIVPTVFGTTTSPRAFLAITVLVIIRWTGTGVDLTR